MTDERGAALAHLRSHGITEISPLGERVANFLADLLNGAHHLRGDILDAEWSNPHWIAVRWRRDLATYDSDLLTRLVFLAHDHCLRLTVDPRSHQAQTLLFHARQRGGWHHQHHPTIEEALAEHRRRHPLSLPWETH